MSIVVDMTDRIAATGTVVPLHPQLAPVIDLPRRTSSPSEDAETAATALLYLLLQADGFTNHPSLGDKDRSEYRGQVQAYAFALGVVAHPGSPQDAVLVQRAVLASIADGRRGFDDLHDLVFPDTMPPSAG